MAQAQAEAQVNTPAVQATAALVHTLGNHNLLDFNDPKDIKYYCKAIPWIAEKNDLTSEKLFR
jgi:hypothetical protein